MIRRSGWIWLFCAPAGQVMHNEVALCVLCFFCVFCICRACARSISARSLTAVPRLLMPPRSAPRKQEIRKPEIQHSENGKKKARSGARVTARPNFGVCSRDLLCALLGNSTLESPFPPSRPNKRNLKHVFLGCKCPPLVFRMMGGIWGHVWTKH